MDRRKFLKLVGAALVVTTVLPGHIINIPKIWANGIHDDTLGFRALVSGEPFEWMGEGSGPTYEAGVDRDTIFLPSGTLALSTPIIVGNNTSIIGSNKRSTNARLSG